MNELEIPGEFIVENTNISQSKPKSQGPYSKHDRQARRDEVYKLHFDHGYSGRKISELMKISRNTINSDIQYWYSKLTANRKFDPEDRITESLIRLRTQKNRLREKLDNTNSIPEQITVERLLFDIESKIINTEIRISESTIRTYDQGVQYANAWLKANEKDYRATNSFDIFRCSKETQTKIITLLQNDKKRNTPRYV